MVYKTISVMAIIGKIYRDLKISSSSFEADAVEWCAEALDFIGYHAAFKKRTRTLTTKDYRAALPTDLYNVIGVYYEGDKLPLGDSSNINDNYYDKSNVYISAKTEVLESTNFEMTQYGSRLYNDDSDSLYNYYLINPNYVITSFETGEIELVYNAWPTDKDGLPEVPDNIYYKQALEWYIIRQLLMRGYEHPNKEFTYSFADAKWAKYCNSAQNDVAMPTPDKAERFRNMWVRLIPDHNLDLNQLIDSDTHG